MEGGLVDEAGDGGVPWEGIEDMRGEERYLG